ncbi:MAG: PTS transporter subunit EIIC [Tenericutes bacterium]|nr:PTS transporter subunit EIIC [Mycoplasmatota bacterium]
MRKVFAELQKIGKALMLPVATLPIAALLMRLGAGDLLNIPVMAAAGTVIFANLPIIFGIGVAIGLSKDGHGAAALSGAVAYFVITEVTATMDPTINMGVLSGIIGGYLAAKMYNQFSNIKVPQVLGFFGGKRFVPIVTGVAALILGIVFGWVWPPIQNAIQAFGEFLTGAGAVGVGIYGTFNALLLPTGLHHILNSLVWFVFGDFTNAAGEVVSGDLFRYFAGDPTAGNFMAGFYPVFMFGMLGAALAMYRTSKPENRKKIGGLLLGAAGTFALTGIGEPLLFLFIFTAPILFVAHALLQGSALAVTTLLGVKHGFGFSAGLIDYVLNFGLSTKGWLIIPIGIVYFALYYFLFTFLIKKFNLKTPGREDEVDDEEIEFTGAPDEIALKYVEFLGGKENIQVCDSCITRLRLQLQDPTKLNEAGLKKLGSSGVFKMKNSVQVVVGTHAEFIAQDINKVLKMK